MDKIMTIRAIYQQFMATFKTNSEALNSKWKNVSEEVERHLLPHHRFHHRLIPKRKSRTTLQLNAEVLAEVCLHS
jgi:hypothetical protein